MHICLHSDNDVISWESNNPSDFVTQSFFGFQATLPVFAPCWNCCTGSETAVVTLEAQRYLIMSQREKGKLMKSCWISMHNKKSKVFLRALCAISILVQLARYDRANRGVPYPVQPHIFCAPLFVFDKTLTQPRFAVVNCSKTMLSVFYCLFQCAA